MTLDELDRLAAEKVMDNYGLLLRSDKIWQPTRNIAQAWECLESCIQSELGKPNVWLRESGTWTCRFMAWNTLQDLAEADGQSAPEAIVRACLKAKGVELE